MFFFRWFFEHLESVTCFELYEIRKISYMIRRESTGIHAQQIREESCKKSCGSQRVQNTSQTQIEFSEIPYVQISRRHQNLCIICYILSRGFDEDFCNLFNSI